MRRDHDVNILTLSSWVTCMWIYCTNGAGI